MKTFQTIISAALSLMVVALIGCNKQKGTVIDHSEGANGGDISNYTVYEEYKTASASYLCEGDTTFGKSTTVYTTASISVQWPRRFGDANVKALQDTIIAHTFIAPKASIDSCIIDFVSKPIGYGESVLKRVADVPEQSENVRVLSKNTPVKTVGFCEKYVVFKIEQDQFTGGAHPNYFANYVNYDLKNKRVLTYANIFKQGCDDALLPILKNALLHNYYAETLDEVAEKSGIFIDELFVSHKLYLTGDDIVFFYNPYDIGPWAIGTVEISVPVDELTDFMSDYGKALYGIK